MSSLCLTAAHELANVCVGGDDTRLTTQQRIASASSLRNVFIEAEPGSGKTTVAARRFGVLRYTAKRDSRAVVAVSFARSATRELRGRVLRAWGPSVLHWPHQVSTIDALMRRVAAALLTGGHVEWPGSHTELNVIDDWRSVTDVVWQATETRVRLVERVVVVSSSRSWDRRLGPSPAAVEAHIQQGICTHDDIRSVLKMLSTTTSFENM
jgi:DNA helicase II / ATP-dependent DNA helicase PcrA